MKEIIAFAVVTACSLTVVSASESEPAWSPAVEPKPLSPTVEKGVGWLLEHQHENGGWSQGEESSAMGRGAERSDLPNVGDTAISLLALLRAGYTPGEGPHAAALSRAVSFVCGEIEASDPASLDVTSVRGTRLQSKLGSYVDTFLAALVLPELKGMMASEEENRRVEEALDRVLKKIEKNQRGDGSFGGGGWANALSQGLAAKGYNRAAQTGAEVDETVRERLEEQAAGRYDAGSKRFEASDAAGVDLYAGASSLSALQDSDNTNRELKKDLEGQLEQVQSEDEAGKIRSTLDRIETNQQRLRETKQAVVERLGDDGFVAGFGSNGGEEFLSYMNIGESLVVDGGQAWDQWDRKITANLERIQNEDGSWTGHHCITGRNFCTASALLVLMTDRAPVPLSAGLARR